MHLASDRWEAYLDIETTGLSPEYCQITVIGIYITNGSEERVVQLVGEKISAEAIEEALEGVSELYTYNGRRFDLPFIFARYGVDVRPKNPDEAGAATLGPHGCARRESGACEEGEEMLILAGIALIIFLAAVWPALSSGGTSDAPSSSVRVASSDTLQYYTGRAFGRHLLAPGQRAKAIA